MLMTTLIILVKIIVLVIGFGMTAGALMTFFERKQSAYIHNRVGPNRANLKGEIKGEGLVGALRLGGLIHLLADSAKMLFKEDITPRNANRFMHLIAPMLMLFPVLATFAIIPWMDHWCTDGAILVVQHRDVCVSSAENYFSVADLDVGFLYVFAIASLGVYGVSLAGWGSNSKLSLLGGLRAAAQMISYEGAMGLSVLGLVMIYGTLNLNEMVQIQGELIFGVLPKWGVFVQPLGFLLFLTAMIAETKRAPFDVPEGESEIATGYMAEYSGLKWGVMALSEFMAVVFVAAITATLFFGGWQVPYLYGDGFHMPSQVFFTIVGAVFLIIGLPLILTGKARQSFFHSAVGIVLALNGVAFIGMTFFAVGGVLELPYLVVVFARIGAFLLKVVILTWFQLMLRWTLPRFRYDQIMHLGWKVLLPLALINLVITALVLLPIYG